ncbi:MAG: histidine--tRNA ligase [Firmicutes bacterium]|nr:histidine--tRNA ligase [Bacillota bacterium]
MIQKPKGTYDVYGDYGKKILYLEDLLQVLMEKYNYEFVRTPIFEASELFHRGVGETSDIVTKETYDFIDRGERNMTLRPEGTAGVVRSFIENKMYGRAEQPVKTWYYGPMYRYERPQSGRFREFYQFGVEVFGTENPLMDAEVISIPVRFYQLLGLKNIKVNINSLGDSESRENYRKALVEYFKPYLNELCEDCKNRFYKNPLRILDCKVDAKNPIMENAPKMIDYLNDVSKKHFEDVQSYLKAMNIEFVVNPKIVRGLDYYTHTVFEVEASVEGFGSQNVLGAGGRYNNLVSSIGGPDTPGVGFALGLERLITALDFEKINIIEDNHIDVYVIPMSEQENNYCINLVDTIRMNGFSCDTDYLTRNLKSNFKQSERLGAKFIIIVGEVETNTNVLTVKDNSTKEEFKIDKGELVDFLDSRIEHE